MKTYKFLYIKTYSKGNIYTAIENMKLSKRVKRECIQERLYAKDLLAEAASTWIQLYENDSHQPKVIYDGVSKKKREIITPTLKEIVVQHCVVNAMKPMFMKGLYDHTYGSIPGRGAHSGAKVIQKWLKDTKNTKYVLKMDIKKFFDSIPHDILLSKFRRKIKCPDMIDLLEKIISITDKGLPLGFYTSQWFSNYYLMELDHFIKQELKAKYYIRYMDDMVIFGSNKKKLHYMRSEIDLYLRKHLGLELKSNYQVYRFNDGEKYRDLDFMGFRFYRHKTIIRKSIMLKISRKAKRINKKQATIYDAKQIASYYGWIKATNSYNFDRARIKPYINFDRMFDLISKESSDELEFNKIIMKYKGGNDYGSNNV